MIIMIVAIVVLFLSNFLIIIIFKVHGTNNKVLSLFGYIPIPEIKTLA